MRRRMHAPHQRLKVVRMKVMGSYRLLNYLPISLAILLAVFSNEASAQINSSSSDKLRSRNVALAASGLPDSSSEFEAISPDHAREYLGRKVRMKFIVQSIGRGDGGRLIELNSKPVWNAPDNVHVHIPPELAAALLKEGIKNPEQFFQFREIEVTGTLQDRRPGGFLVPALEPASVENLQYVLRSARPAIAISQLNNHRVDLYLSNGKSFANVLISEIETGSHSESFVSVRGTNMDGKQTKYRASAIQELAVDGVPLDVMYDKVKKEGIADQSKREARIHEGKASELRLASQGYQLHRRRTDEEQEKSLKANREFAASVKAFFPELPIRTMERDLFLIVTDIPPERGDVYFQYLDRLYEDMCNSFGVPVGTNLWQGKCIVCAFQDRAKFVQFEVDMMKHSRESASMSGGLCHGGDDRIVISLFKGDLPDARFAYVLVHETSHGIVNRYLSDAQIPSWLNEGMALWIGAMIVKEDKDTLQSSLEESIATMRQQQSLDGMFEVEQIHGKYYGASAAIVDMLLNKKKGAFRKFFIDLKNGYSQEEALQRSFGITLQQLATEYGRTIGVPQLTLQ